MAINLFLYCLSLLDRKDLFRELRACECEVESVVVYRVRVLLIIDCDIGSDPTRILDRGSRQRSHRVVIGCCKFVIRYPVRQRVLTLVDDYGH